MSPAAPDIAIASADGILFAAWLQDGVVTDLWAQRETDRLLEGTVLAGRISKRLPGNHGAWVDIGLGRSAPLAAPADVREGTLLPLQLRRPARAMRGGKLPPLTRDIALPGRFLVYRPLGEGVSFSRKLEKSRRVVPAGLSDGPGGWLVRAALDGANEGAIRHEIAWLTRYGAPLADMPGSAKPGTILLDGPTVGQRAILDAGTQSGALHIDGTVPGRALTSWISMAAPDLAPALRQDSHAALQTLIEEPSPLLSPAVALSGGGTVWIEPTRALTAVDIDAPIGSDPIACNRAAAAVLAREIRLRNLGGLFAVDFLRMGRPGDKAKILEFLQNALKDSPAQHHFDSKMSASGPYLFSRQQHGTPLADILDTGDVHYGDIHYGETHNHAQSDP